MTVGESMWEEHLCRDNGLPFPPTYLVVRFARHFNLKCLLWFINKIRGRKRDGGAELLVRRQPLTDSLTKGVTIHLSASTAKVLEVAEELEMRKYDSAGILREFVLTQTDCFLRDGLTEDDLFTAAEKQTIVKHELESIRAVTKDDYLPGYPTIKLFAGQSIFHLLVRYGFIEKCYPLHDADTLKKLGHEWYLTLNKYQPYEEIRHYFGENVALYFIFLGYYTAGLVPPMILGLLELFIPQTTTVFFCVFNVLWVTLFLELWKRKSSELAFQWGTIGMTSLDEPRPEFRGEMGIDEVTGRYQPKYSRWKTNVKVYCVSLPVVVLCLIFAFCIMLISFFCESLVIENRKAAGDDSLSGTIIVSLPSATYAGLVYVMNWYYKKLATFLTEWENHRTQSQFERHRVTKLVLFEFINNFMSLFYIAFVIQDMEMLRSQLATMLIILQGFNNIQEAVLPLIIRCYGKPISKSLKCLKYQRLFNGSSSSLSADDGNKNFAKDVSHMLQGVPLLNEDDPRIEQAIYEARLETYEGTYDDYLEMFVQFGYVFLFSSVYPMAAFWAVANNVLEIRGDAFKLCKLCQRTMPRKVKDIGAWQKAFEWLGAMSILTNCGLMCISPQLRALAPDVGAVEWVLIFVLVEHVLLLLRQLLHDAISEKPEWVRIALAKINYQSKQALKNERILKNRMHFSQRRKT